MRTCLLLPLTLQLAGDPLPADVLARIRQQLMSADRYACTLTTTRDRTGETCSNCRVTDRWRFELLFADGKELAALPGSSHFEDRTADDHVRSGALVLGHFAGIASAIFLEDRASFARLGPLEYDFEVPAIRSDLEIRNGDIGTKTGYRGRFRLGTGTPDLERLEIRADRIPEWVGIVRVRTAIEYKRVQVGASTAVLPVKTETEMISAGHVRSVNRSEYTGCREFTAASQVTFGPGRAEGPTTAATPMPLSFRPVSNSACKSWNRCEPTVLPLVTSCGSRSRKSPTGGSNGCAKGTR